MIFRDMSAHCFDCLVLQRSAPIVANVLIDWLACGDIPKRTAFYRTRQLSAPRLSPSRSGLHSFYTTYKDVMCGVGSLLQWVTKFMNGIMLLFLLTWEGGGWGEE